MDSIADYLSPEDILGQCAEECSELSQACLKMIRKIKGENPTPKTMQEITNSLNEEIADVLVSVSALLDTGLLSQESIESTMLVKHERWLVRLKQNKINEEKGEN